MDAKECEPQDRSTDISELLALVASRLTRIETSLDLLVQQKLVKEWYTTAEVAKVLDKANFTVREWCRLRRIRAEKRECGRGDSLEWMISHEELTRVQNEGLLSAAKYRHYR